jgi:sec-independent protein translocase protein TatA
MFGIGGSEILFIIIISIMLFGADKIPEIARTLGKGMAQLKNATEEIKSEINKSAQNHGIDVPSATNRIDREIESAKQGFNKMIADAEDNQIVKDVTDIKSTIEDLPDGPIKRN